MKEKIAFSQKRFPLLSGLGQKW